jgi:HEPN domain-containing protein
MIDIAKQIEYWTTGSEEELSVAYTLFNSRKFRHSLFFAHLTLEKILKATVCKKTNNIAPRIHNLVRLIEITEITLTEDQLDFFVEMNIYNLEGRYPANTIPLPDQDTIKIYLDKTEEILQWLMKLLK